MELAIPQEAVTRIQLEFVEMPGLMLTPTQVSRLCGLTPDVCEGALTLLMKTGFLSVGSNGSFRRPSAR
jgi:hypothetical protein